MSLKGFATASAPDTGVHDALKVTVAGDPAFRRKVVLSSLFWTIDNCWLFREGVDTQIKRAYELSVCLLGRRSQNPDYRVGGCAWRIGISIDAKVNDSQTLASDVYCSASISWRSVDDLRR